MGYARTRWPGADEVRVENGGVLEWAEFALKERGEKAVSVVNDRGGQSHVPDFQFELPPCSFEPKHLLTCLYPVPESGDQNVGRTYVI